MNINFAPPPVQTQGFVDPNEIARREAIARALQEQSAGMQDIQSPWQGVNQVAQAVVGGLGAQRASQDQQANQQALIEALSGTADGTPLTQDKLAMIMALNPELGMGMMQDQQSRTAAQSEKQQAADALRAMGLTQQADAVMSGVLTLDDASEMLQERWKAPEAPEALKAPAGYQYGEDGGSLSPIPGGPADPANPLNARRAQGGAPSATIQKEIFEADEGVQAGNNVIQALDTALELNATAWDGPLADIGSQGGALFGNQDAVATQTLKNVVTANALESLRATFGGNPTEGERKILIDVQGSVGQSRAVREAIFKRAKAAAERRIQFNSEKARSLRSSDYFDEGYSPVMNAPGGETSGYTILSVE